MSKSVSNALSYAAGALAFGLVMALPATAQDLNSQVSCFYGNVPAADYAELGANFRETLWDNSAGVRLASSSTQMEVYVTDENGNDVCEDRADMTAECRFRLRTGSSFWIKVDNTKFDREGTYKLCAF